MRTVCSKCRWCKFYRCDVNYDTGVCMNCEYEQMNEALDAQPDNFGRYVLVESGKIYDIRSGNFYLLDDELIQIVYGNNGSEKPVSRGIAESWSKNIDLVKRHKKRLKKDGQK